MVNSLVYRRDKKLKKKKEPWICHNRRDRKASDRIKVGGYGCGGCRGWFINKLRQDRDTKDGEVVCLVVIGLPIAWKMKYRRLLCPLTFPIFSNIVSRYSNDSFLILIIKYPYFS